MAQDISPYVARIVTRYYEYRSQGRQVSVDELLGDCPDAATRAEVRREVLSELCQRFRSRATTQDSSSEPPPELADYDIVDILGRGGMGVVYEAYRRSTGQRVALKVLSAAMRTDANLRRFEREVNLLLHLRHPSIRRVIDAGVDGGHHYYAMEYINGRSLAEAVRPGTLPAKQVFRLLATIAEVVDYAHEQGVLHRDLKPSNVLIDTGGGVHLLDFGLAKPLATETETVGQQSVTQPAQLVGTMAYIAPEQALGQADRICVGSDVYALGAMAYELLTGQQPCDVEGPLPEVLTRIANDAPPPPSQLRPTLSADVDAILLKALAKQPVQRYASAAAFAADLRSYLADQPILARRAGTLGRAARWSRRHRGLAVGSSVAVLLAVTATGLAFWHVVTERDRAVAHHQQAQRMMAAMQDLLVTRDASPNRCRDAVLRDQLDDWETGIAKYVDQPAIEAGLRMILGQVAAQCGDHVRATRDLTRAISLYRHDPDATVELAGALFTLARTRQQLADYDTAETLYQEALTLRQQSLGPRAPEVAETLERLAEVARDQNHLDAAGDFYADACAILRTLRGDYRLELAGLLDQHAQLLVRQNRPDDALPLLRQALGLRRDALGQQHVDVAATLASLGTALEACGNAQAATQILRDALTQQRALLGNNAPATLDTQEQLGLVLHDLGRYVQAEALLRASLEQRIAGAGMEFRTDVALSKQRLAALLVDLARYDEAEQLLLVTLDTWQRVLPDYEHQPQTADTYYTLADLARARGRLDRARDYCARALTIRRMSATTEENADVGQCLLLLGRITLAEGQPKEAEQLLRSALNVLTGSPRRLWTAAVCRSVLGESLLTQGRLAEAEPLLVSSFKTLRPRADLRHRAVQAALQRLIDYYERDGRRPDLEATYRTLRENSLPN